MGIQSPVLSTTWASAALVICLICIGLSSAENVKGASARSPKLFFVSSKSTTSTVSTTTLCYTSIANAAVVSCGRKKRAIMDEVLGFVDKTPVAIEADAPHETVEDIVSGMDEVSAERQGKFLLYWLPTTSTSTLPSSTAPAPLVVSCLPSGINQCG